MEAAKCYRCIPNDIAKGAMISLLCEWASASEFACGTPSDIIEITGAGLPAANQRYFPTVIPNQWKGVTDPTITLELIGGQYLLQSLFDPDQYYCSPAEFPCVWHLLPTGTGPAPTGAYIDNFTTPEVDQILAGIDASGEINGTIDLSGNTPLAPPDAAGLVDKASLEGKGWTVIVDPPTSVVIIDDGTATFWRLIVDTLGNIGTQSDPGPATPDIILDDGGGGFWKVIVDTNGNRGTTTHAGPASLPVVLNDGMGGLWTLIVDVNGNLGATL